MPFVHIYLNPKGYRSWRFIFKVHLKRWTDLPKPKMQQPTHFHVSCWTHNQLWESTGNLCIQENFHLLSGKSKQDSGKLSRANLVPCWKSTTFCAIAPAFLPWRPEIRSCKREISSVQQWQQLHKTAWPQKKTCQVLIQGRGWHRLTLKSALSSRPLVPQLNYWQGHISDFSIKMFYVEPGGFERCWKCFPFLSHSSLPVCKNQTVFGFSGPGMWLRTCAKGRKSKDGCPGSAEPHIPTLKEGAPRERQTQSSSFPSSLPSLHQSTADPGVTAFPFSRLQYRFLSQWTFNEQNVIQKEETAFLVINFCYCESWKATWDHTHTHRVINALQMCKEESESAPKKTKRMSPPQSIGIVPSMNTSTQPQGGEVICSKTLMKKQHWL